MFESNADLSAYVRQEGHSRCEEQTSEAVGAALAKACCFQFIFLFVCGVLVTRILYFPWDIGGVIAFVFAFVSFIPYFAFMVKEERTKKADL